VPTIRLRVLFVFLVIEHERRRVLHFGVTEHPTAEWTAQQMAEAFSERDARRYLIRDRDAIYGNAFRCRIQSLAMKEVVTAPRSPWRTFCANCARRSSRSNWTVGIEIRQLGHRTGGTMCSANDSSISITPC
jgi:hypothetical protein